MTRCPCSVVAGSLCTTVCPAPTVTVASSSAPPAPVAVTVACTSAVPGFVSCSTPPGEVKVPKDVPASTGATWAESPRVNAMPAITGASELT